MPLLYYLLGWRSFGWSVISHFLALVFLQVILYDDDSNNIINNNSIIVLDTQSNNTNRRLINASNIKELYPNVTKHIETGINEIANGGIMKSNEYKREKFISAVFIALHYPAVSICYLVDSSLNVLYIIWIQFFNVLFIDACVSS